MGFEQPHRQPQQYDLDLGHDQPELEQEATKTEAPGTSKKASMLERGDFSLDHQAAIKNVFSVGGVKVNIELENGKTFFLDNDDELTVR